jgi:uncharacterized lipoprotein YbaY
MKTNLPVLIAAAAVALLAAGCANLDVTPESNPERVLTGTVTARAMLPAGAQVLVRVVEVSNRDVGRAAGSDLPVVNRPPAMPIERVVGEQTQILAAATNDPVPYRIEYRADDTTLRRGLNVEARISVEGKVRHRNVSAHVLTLASSPYKHEIVVDPVQ